jgi:hypothetical protein
MPDETGGPDEFDNALRPWLERLSPRQRREAEAALAREPDLRAELAVFLRDAREFDRWLGALAPDERAPVELAIAHDPDLREEVGVVIGGMDSALREVFLRRFQRAIVNGAPRSPLLEGLQGVASKIRRDRRQNADDAA